MVMKGYLKDTHSKLPLIILFVAFVITCTWGAQEDADDFTAIVCPPSKSGQFYRVNITWRKNAHRSNHYVLSRMKENDHMTLKQYHNERYWKRVGKCRIIRSYTDASEVVNHTHSSLQCIIQKEDFVNTNALKLILWESIKYNENHKWTEIRRKYLGSIKSFQCSNTDVAIVEKKREEEKFNFKINVTKYNKENNNNAMVWWPSFPAKYEIIKTKVFANNVSLGTTRCTCPQKFSCHDDGKPKAKVNSNSKTCSLLIINLSNCTSYDICVKVVYTGTNNTLHNSNNTLHNSNSMLHNRNSMLHNKNSNNTGKFSFFSCVEYKTTDCEYAVVETPSGRKKWSVMLIFLVSVMSIAGILLIAICILYVINATDTVNHAELQGYDPMDNDNDNAVTMPKIHHTDDTPP